MAEKPRLGHFILAGMILFTPDAMAQRYQKAGLRLEGFSLKTDVISLLTTAIGEDKVYFIAGELYFNDEYSVQLSYKAGNGEEITTSNFQTFGTQFRWYLMQDDCSCSAFYGGFYLNHLNEKQYADSSTGRFIAGYDRMSLDGGFCGGYQGIISDHFVIDPAVQIGTKLFSWQKPEAYSPGSLNHVLLINMQLGIGYRF